MRFINMLVGLRLSLVWYQHGNIDWLALQKIINNSLESVSNLKYFGNCTGCAMWMNVMEIGVDSTIPLDLKLLRNIHFMPNM